MLLQQGWLKSHHFVHGFTQKNENMGWDQYLIFPFLMLINGGKGDCGKVKISLSKPRGGNILLSSTASGKT